MKRLVIFLGICFLLLLAIGFVLLNKPTEDDGLIDKNYILQVITQEFPGFTYDNEALIEIGDVMKFEEKWYVTTVNSPRDSEIRVPVYILLHGDTDNLRVVLGPDAHFTETEMLQYNLPDSIIKELL